MKIRASQSTDAYEKEERKMAGDRMMRYIVPFYFDGAYEEVCRKLSEASDEWEPGQVACRYVYRHIYQTVNYAKGEKEKQGGVWRQNRQSAKINLWLKLRENEAEICVHFR